MKRSIFVPFSALLGLTLTMVAGCGSSKERELKYWEVERIAHQELSSKGRPAPRVNCDQHLDARVGARTVCWMMIEGKQHDVTMTVTSVDGRKVDFDIEVADEPRASSPTPT